MPDQLAGFLKRHGDDVLAGAITALALVGVALLDEPAGARLAIAASAVAVGVAAARRVRVPLLFLSLMVAIVVVTALRLIQVDTVDAFGLFLLLAVYSAAAHTSGRRTLVAGGLTVVLYISLVATDPNGLHADAVVFHALLLGAPWAAGRAVRRRRLSETRLEQEKAKLDAAIVEERTWIARDLHDVVAHSISVIVLQARGGRRLVETEPADAREAFAIIDRTGHQALEEMRRLLGMLRRSDEELALTPQPSLTQLDRLVEHVQAAGLPVQVTVEGEPRELPPGVDVSAYRIVQEALTNALKHAGPARARVLLRYHPDGLELEVADDGPGTGDGSVSGYGLVGMRERVSVYGGELQAGRQPGGGYALRARLPLGSARA
jgi:signal transduction histidine kinase